MGLLADNHKFLIHVVVKGVKGYNFEPVLKWF